jgi:MFS family permease
LERGFVVVCLIRFLMSLSWTMISILLVVYATAFEAPALLGTLWTVIGFARFLAETPSGILVDRVGCKPVIVGGLALIGASYLLFAFAQTAVEVLASSAFAGAGFVVATIGLMVQGAYYAPPDERVRYMGVLHGSMMASNIVGPTLGGLIADSAGLRTAFLAASLTTFVAVLLALLTRDIAVAGSASGVRGLLQDYRLFLQRRLYQALFVVSFLFALTSWGFRSMVLPTYGADVLGLTITQIGVLSSITSTTLFLVQFFLAGRMEHVSRRLLVTLGLLICSVATAAYTVTAEVTGLAAVAAVLGVGLGLVTPALEAIWIDITTAEDRGRLYGLRTAFFDVGQMAWALLLTALGSLGPYTSLYAASAVAFVTALLLFLALRAFR